MTIEASMKIVRRYQYFLWTQGSLQSFLPHESLLCAHGDIANKRYQVDLFSRNIVDDSVKERMGCRSLGLMAHLIPEWFGAGRSPGALAPQHCKDLPESLQATMGNLASSGLTWHGAPEAKGEQGTFFVFMNVPEEATYRHQYFLEILMPHIHTAYVRMRDGDPLEEAKSASADSQLSDREIQVLQWVREGKTNYEIGHILNISPLTVKNHVQKILRKLTVSNRAQAVAKAHSTGLFDEPAA